MKTFETEKNNIPEGATHYFEETKEEHFAWWNDDAQMLLDPENANEWTTPNAYDDVSNPVEIPQQEAKMNIDKLATQVEEVEWDGNGLPPVGVECEWIGGGLNHGDWGLVIVHAYHNDFAWIEKLRDSSMHTVGNPAHFRKPESPQQREERERLEAAKSLFGVYRKSQSPHIVDWDNLGEDNKLGFLAIVDKTNYRKES